MTQTAFDYNGEISWCPGCGDYKILESLKMANFFTFNLLFFSSLLEYLVLKIDFLYLVLLVYQ